MGKKCEKFLNIKESSPESASNIPRNTETECYEGLRFSKEGS